nr:DUF4142 domain-containing protein [Cytophagales bacterium]
MKKANFYSKMIHGMCIAGSMFIGTSVSAFQVSGSVSDPSIEVAEQDTLATNDHDKMFVSEAVKMNLNEIALANLAQEKDVPSYIKVLANTIEEDHMQAMADISEMAQAKNIPLDTPDTHEKSEEVEKLESLDGHEFGKAYSELMVEKHKKTIEKFEKAAMDAEDPEIKSWVNERLPILRSHLEEAEKCHMACMKEEKEQTLN